MTYKSKSHTWLGEEIEFEVNGTVHTKIKDPASPDGMRDVTILFENWDDIKGAELLTLQLLYEDVYPEFITDGILNLDLIEEMFPGTEFVFKMDQPIDDEEEIIEEPKTYKKKPQKDLDQYFADMKAELKNELKEELLAEIRVDFNLVPKDAVKYNIPAGHKVIQKGLNGEFIKSFISAKEAGDIIKIAASSISGCINGKRRSAGGFMWSAVK